MLDDDDDVLFYVVAITSMIRDSRVGLYRPSITLHYNAIMSNIIQYKNDFYSAVIEGAEALVGRL